jgi:hypothetical protein
MIKVGVKSQKDKYLGVEGVFSFFALEHKLKIGGLIRL